MRESEIQSWSVDYARRQGWWVRKFRSQHRRSAPDCIFAKGGQVFFVEFKATGEKPTPLQEKEHEDMRDAGLTVYVCDSREQFRRVFGGECASLYVDELMLDAAVEERS